MPETGPGGLDNHTHSFEWGMNQTAMADGHLHIMKKDHSITAPANGHDHWLPVKAPPGIDQDVLDSEFGQ